MQHSLPIKIVGMKFTDNLIKKIGADKLLHFCVAGWVVSLAGYLGVTSMIIATIILILCSAVKEMWMDDKPDYYDVIAAILGIIITWVVALSTY